LTKELIATKLNIPQMPARLVRRQRLHDLLSENTSWRLLLVSAPAGFGKTTFVQSWIGQTAWPAAWVSLDENDNDPARFLAYFVRALQMVDESVGTAVTQTLQSLQPTSVGDIFVRLLNDINAIERPFVLVLDDWHVINEVSLLAGLELMVTNQPPHMHLVIITREDPTLPLARLRARGQMVEVRAQDLRFNPDEAAVFLNDRMGVELNRDEVALLEARTEGWAAGLQLAAISMQREPDKKAAFVEAFSGSHRFVLDYLADEVLAHLTEEVCDFLLKTAILDQLTASLCNAVTGRHDSQTLLRQIEEMNLFLIQLDHERQWYRYHHLFAEMLQKQLYQTQSDAIAKLHLRASIWYEDQGLVTEAIHHAHAASEMERLAGLIEQHALEVIKRGQIYQAKKWIEMLPAAIRQARPRISMDYGWALFLSNDFEPLFDVLDQIEKTAVTTPDILGEASALRAFLVIDSPGQMQEYALHALDIVPEDNVLVRGLVHMALANVYQLLDDKEKAFDQFSQAIRLHWAAGNKVAAGIAVLDLVLVNLALGQWRRTHQLIEQFLNLARQDDALDDPAIGIALIGEGLVLLHQNRPDEAVTTINRGLTLAESGGYQAAVYGRLPLAEALILQGNQAEARQTLTAFSSKMADIPETANTVLTVMLSHAYLLLEDVDAARQWLGEGENETPIAPLESYRRITGARLAIAQADHQQALAVLNDVIYQIASQNWNGYLSEAYNLRAIAQEALGNTAAALDDLRHALTLAESEGDVYAFLREGPAMRTLLAHAPQTAFVQSLLAAFAALPQADKAEFSHPALVEPLSEREVEVVRLMVEGLTYNDIAQRLMISVNTVRYHIKGLYSKLGVSSRAEAIERARQLTLLD
jgi:LuxR family maltose regulon positive regulatory protein